MPSSAKQPEAAKRFAEWATIATMVGQNIAGALSGKQSVDQALKASQAAAQRPMVQAGYIK
jgi:sorbitol/mannitol transport system substrate-binding protein